MSGQDLVGVFILIGFIALMVGVGVYAKAERTKAAAMKAEKKETSSKV